MRQHSETTAEQRRMSYEDIRREQQKLRPLRERKFQIGSFTPFVREDRSMKDAYLSFDTLYVPCMYEFLVAMYYANNKPMDIEEFANDASSHAMHVVRQSIARSVAKADIKLDTRFARWERTIHDRRLWGKYAIKRLDAAAAAMMQVTAMLSELNQAIAHNIASVQVFNEVAKEVESWN